MYTLRGTNIIPVRGPTINFRKSTFVPMHCNVHILSPIDLWFRTNSCCRLFYTVKEYLNTFQCSRSFIIFNRPGVARDVQKTTLSLNN